MYTSISGSGRPSLGVCSLDYAGELHKRGIQRVKVRLRGGGDASARGDFRVPFPGDTLASCDPWKRGVTNVSLSLLLRAEIKFRLNGSQTVFYLPELSEGVPKQIKGSLSLYFSLSLSSSLHPPSSFFVFWFFGFHPWRNAEGFLSFNLTRFHFLEKLKAYSVLCCYVAFHHAMVKLHSSFVFLTEFYLVLYFTV